MSRPAERVALVSGGNRGIGLAAVTGLAAAGLTVVLGARDQASGEAARDTIDNGAGIKVQQLDVSAAASVEECIAAIDRDYGRLDVLVNNAGVVLDSGERATTPDFSLVRETLEVNVFGAWRLTSAAIDLIRAAGHGRIINVSSGMGQLADMGAGAPGYRLSKTALNALTRMFAAELGAGFSVNSVCPGWVRTDLGGPSAPRSPGEGADTIVWLATVAPEMAPTGGFYRDRKEIPW